MTLVGYNVLVPLPAINSAWVDQLGFTDVEVNRVASADAGLFLGSVAAAFSIRGQSTPHMQHCACYLANWLSSTGPVTSRWFGSAAWRALGQACIPATPSLGWGKVKASKPSISCCFFAVSSFWVQLIPLLSMDMIYVFSSRRNVTIRSFAGCPQRIWLPLRSGDRNNERALRPGVGGHLRYRRGLHQHWCLLGQYWLQPKMPDWTAIGQDR